uniref:Uncharacterized protein n=1 Tax=Physcomitrium patens TaxID=3218 RepID=A0A2K1J7M0_PHYPA|nr:hypothetical protein PHYPA_020633 [Physcomitrium patens]
MELNTSPRSRYSKHIFCGML